MTYTDFQIHAPDEDTAKLAASEIPPDMALLDDDGEWITASARHALDPIGTVYNDDAVFDAETENVTSPATAKDGWFANLRVRDEIAADVEALFAAIGEPMGVTLGVDTGRVWA